MLIAIIKKLNLLPAPNLNLFSAFYYNLPPLYKLDIQQKNKYFTNLLHIPGYTVKKLKIKKNIVNFLLLLNSGWGFLDYSLKILKKNYYPFLINTNSKNLLVNFPVLSYKAKFNKHALMFNPAIQWQNFSNFVNFFNTLIFYNVKSLAFANKFLSKSVNFFNWKYGGLSTNTFLSIRFFFLFSKNLPQSQIYLILRGLNHRYNVNFVFFFSVYTFLKNLKVCSLLNLCSGGLTDINIEPWLLWYPVFCNGSHILIQKIFCLTITSNMVFLW